jgi:cytochrome c peroxidase
LIWFGAGPALALQPPESYVLAEDGTTKLTLEQAGILKPGGKQWAIVLGKALFWDRQTGSDGTACASCHAHAGADTRLRNQINPGFNDITKGAGGDATFGSERSDDNSVPAGAMPSGAVASANYELQPADMPLHQLANERDRNSAIRTTTNDRVSSQGAFAGAFTATRVGGQFDRCGGRDSRGFFDGSHPMRQVEPRNTPTTINAAFFHRNFWDNRANSLFNGVGVFGMRDIVGNPAAGIPGDPDKRLIILNGGVPELGFLQVENASLASQAVGPPLSELEMSCAGRKFADVGRRLLETIPLFLQKVDRTDSVLGPYASASGKGLRPEHRYAALIEKAFDPKYWSAPGRYRITGGQLSTDPLGYTQKEINFSMFWGIAIMLYEQTLVSDQSEFDKLKADGKLVVTPRFVPVDVTPPGVPKGNCTGSDVDPLLLRGCQIFARFTVTGGPPTDGGAPGGNCFVCHNANGSAVGAGGVVGKTPLLSQAALEQNETFALMIQVGKNLGGVHRHDQGTMSIGLRPVFTDLINGGTDPYGNPLSFSRQLQNYLANGNNPSYLVDPVLQRAVTGGAPAAANPLGVTGLAPVLGADGAAKSPILRNVALTPPYFSWGGYPSLRQALKLYNRGLNRRDINAGNALKEAAAGTACTAGDNTGTGPDGNQPYPLTGVTNCDSNTTGTILPLGLLDCDPDPTTGVPPVACAASGKTAANDDLAALERFLKALTDRRVQCDMAPFDHPELQITNGHDESTPNANGNATDIVFTLPAVGEAGYAPSSGYCIPNAGDLFAAGMQGRFGGVRVPLQ